MAKDTYAGSEKYSGDYSATYRYYVKYSGFIKLPS